MAIAQSSDVQWNGAGKRRFKDMMFGEAEGWQEVKRLIPSFLSIKGIDLLTCCFEDEFGITKVCLFP